MKIEVLGTKGRPGSGEAQSWMNSQDFTKDSCNLWPFILDKGGYASSISHKGKKYRPQRLSCELVYGPAPQPKMEAAHSCKNRSCINPFHIRWATTEQNAQDRIKDGTQTYGSSNGNSKLSEADVIGIRSVRKNHGFSYAQLARIFGMSKSGIAPIITGQSWNRVVMEEGK